MGILIDRIPEEAFGGLDQPRGGEPLIGQDEKGMVGKGLAAAPAFPSCKPKGDRDNGVLDDVPQSSSAQIVRGKGPAFPTSGTNRPITDALLPLRHLLIVSLDFRLKIDNNASRIRLGERGPNPV